MGIDSVGGRGFAERVDMEVFGHKGPENDNGTVESFVEALADGQLTNEEYLALKSLSRDSDRFDEILTGNLGAEAVNRLQSADSEPVELAFFDGDNAIVVPEISEPAEPESLGFLRHVLEDANDIANEGVIIEESSMITVDVEGNTATLNFDNFNPSNEQIDAKISEMNANIARRNSAIERHNQQHPDNQLELITPLSSDNTADRQSAINSLAQEEARRIAGEAGLRVDSGILEFQTLQEEGANSDGNSFTGTIVIRQTGAEQE